MSVYLLWLGYPINDLREALNRILRDPQPSGLQRGTPIIRSGGAFGTLKSAGTSPTIATSGASPLTAAN
jgi:hypothetical protein